MNEYPHTPQKQCTVCKQFKAITKDCFHVAKDNADGFRNQCKDCHNADRRNRHFANREHELERFRTYRTTHEEEMRQYRHDYYAQHQETLIEVARVYRTTYPDRAKRSQEAWRVANHEKLHAYKVAYRATHAEQIRAYSASYGSSHIEQIRAYRHARLLQFRAYAHAYRTRKYQNGGTHTAQDILDQLKRQRRRCYYCHHKLNKYHIEHVIPIARGGRNDKWNIVISCPSCNHKKHNKLLHEWPEGGRLL